MACFVTNLGYGGARRCLPGVLAVLGALVLMPLGFDGARASDPVVSESAQAAPDCTLPTVTTARLLMERLNAALKTRHPDRVTELFAKDAEFLGFASSVPRNSYASIREYFLYYLQFEPQVRVNSLQVQSGCNFFVDSGTLVLTLRSKPAAETRVLDVRYNMSFAFVDGDWRITHYVEVPAKPIDPALGLVVPPPGGAKPVVAPVAAAPVARPVAAVPAARPPAVAGFLRRSEPPVKPRVHRAALKAARVSGEGPPEATPGSWVPDWNSFGP